MLDGIMGTIDQQVDDKKDLLRANPGMQGTVGKDLIGVMALQKMQKEKQAAENELMLAQQNNPSTIKEQLEREVAGLTQSEMALQTAGIMNQRQQQQQQRQQRPPQQQRPQGIQQAARPPMGGAPRPPMGGAPMAGAPRPMPQGAGIAGAPRPPMMASGGIVGFQRGGPMPSKEEDVPSGFEKVAGDVLKWAKDNPIEAVAAGMMFVPGIGWMGSGALRGAAATLKAGKALYSKAKAVDYGSKLKKAVDVAKATPGKAADIAKASVTRPSTKNFRIDHKTGARNPVGREYSPGMTATTGAGIMGAKKIFGGDDAQAQQDFTIDQIRSDIQTNRDMLDAKIPSDESNPVIRNALQDALNAKKQNQGGTGGTGGLAGTQTGSNYQEMLADKMNTGVTDAQEIKAQAQGDEVMGRLPEGMKDTLTSMSKTQEQMDQARTAETTSARADYDKNYDAAGLKSRRDATDAELRRQLTPEALKDQRLRAGAVQRGGLAGARARADNRADARRYKLYNDAANNYANDMKADVEKVKAVDTRVGAYMDRLYADRVASVQVFGDLTIAEQQAVTEARNRFQAQNEAAMEAVLTVLGFESQERVASAVRAEAAIPALLQIGQTLKANKQKSIDAFMDGFEYKQAPDATEYDSMGNIKNKGKAVVLLEFTNSLDKNFEFIENVLNQQIARLMQVDLPAFTSGSGGGSPTIDTSGLQDGDL